MIYASPTGKNHSIHSTAVRSQKASCVWVKLNREAGRKKQSIHGARELECICRRARAGVCARETFLRHIHHFRLFNSVVLVTNYWVPLCFKYPRKGSTTQLVQAQQCRRETAALLRPDRSLLQCTTHVPCCARSPSAILLTYSITVVVNNRLMGRVLRLALWNLMGLMLFLKINSRRQNSMKEPP